MSETYSICFVCSGNICRSPTAEVVMRAMLDDAGLGERVRVDSAGMGGWHVGEGADPRSVHAMADAGYDGSGHVVKQWRKAFFADRDLVIALDRGHEQDLVAMAPDARSAEKVRLLRSFDPAAVARGDLEVDDPWYGDAAGFRRTLEEIEAACRGLLAAVSAKV